MKKSLLLIVSLIFLVGCAAKKRQIVVIDEPVKEEVVVEIDQTPSGANRDAGRGRSLCQKKIKRW